MTALNDMPKPDWKWVWDKTSKEPAHEPLKVTYEVYGIKVTVEIPLGEPEEVMKRLMKTAETITSLQKAYKAIKG